MTTLVHTTTRLRGATLILFALTLSTAAVRAQIGNDNPTGPAGAFNGNITTGCSYDPFTGNAQRSITDLAVTGSVGKYPLAFGRTANSRLPQAGNFGFGDAGGWRHSYAWDIDGSEESSDSSFRPTVYPVTFPDGRMVFFAASSSDAPYFRGPPGVPERFKPIDFTTMKAYLLLPDGGKIEFLALRVVNECNFETQPPCSYSYRYQAQAIIDPHGLRTTLSYNGDGSLFQVQERAGRWIKLYYTPTPWSGSRVIDHIEASDGRIVTYHYAQNSFWPGTALFTHLGNVVYPFEPALNLSPTAFYTYKAPNGPNPNGFPLLASADDPMYAGPMKKISYTYATSNGDPSVTVAAGQILSENNGNTGQMVSQLYVPFLTRRDEYRGDGPYRRLEYDGGLLRRYTDFKGQMSTISYENGYVSAFTDAREHRTTYQREGPIGALSVLTHPDPEQSTQRFGYKYVDGAPYFLQIRGDERLVNGVNSNTFFELDPATYRVKKISYPDYPSGPTESFTYNTFGQIETHTTTSGGVENFRYDGRGLMYQSWPPATPSDPNPEQHPTRYFYYPSGPQMDRLWYVIDPRGYSTRFEYNTRGQVTKVTHDQDGTYQQNGYNVDGTLAWTADENHPNASWNVNERTRYIYDDYKRVVSVTNPMNETTTISYAPWNGAGSLSHTTSTVHQTISPLGKQVHQDYDENFRRRIVRQAPGTEDDAWTVYGYDEVGNLTSVQDPRGNVTTFGYDNRNRRRSATNPAPFNNEVTQWEYDTRSNLTKEIRPDGSFRRMEYDALSRVIDTYGFANEHTHYDRDSAGNVWRMIDPKSAVYQFGFDKMNRKISATYPVDATGVGRSEGWYYDWAGNMDEYTNPAGQKKTLRYDTRNRLYNSSWNAGGGPTLGLGYDNASRLRIVTTNGSETTVVFGYDDANRQTWEEQTLSGYPTRRVETPRDTDGNRMSLNVPGYYLIRYDFTQRNQLGHIYGGGLEPWFNYSYDAAGNRTKRQAVMGGVNDSINVPTGWYDALNRPTAWENTKAGDQPFARSHYQYDNVGRETATWRDEQSSKGEKFWFTANDQLAVAEYNADHVWTGDPANWDRWVGYNYTPDKLNRSSVNDSGWISNYAVSPLNQYSAVNGETIYHDSNFNISMHGGWFYYYDSENRLTTVRDWTGALLLRNTYDGLGRCVKREGYHWGGSVLLSTYDGWKPILEWDGGGNFQAWNVYGPGADEILWRYDNGVGHVRYHHDRRGSVTALLDYAGNVIEKYSYDAFGLPRVTDADGNNARTWSNYRNRFMFTGREYYPFLWLYDFRNRWYDMNLGRFLQPDPIGFAAGDANLFRYCGDDPVNRSDPSGLIWGEPVAVTGAIIGTSVGATNGFFYGLGTQIYSYAGGNGFSWSQIGYTTGVNAGAGGLAGLLVGSATSADPATIAEGAITAGAIGGLLQAAIENHVHPPTPPSPTPPAPPQPSIPPLLQRPPELPPVFTAPDGSQIDGNGNRLHDRAGGGENRGSSDSGNFSPFSPGPNSFTTPEGNSIFAGFGPGGFQVSVGGSIVRVYRPF